MRAFAPAATPTGFTGTAPAGSVIEAIDLSTAVGNRLSVEDSKPIGTVGASESFNFSLDGLHGGDYVRMRAKLPDGTYSAWQLVRVPGVDTYAAQVVDRRFAIYEDNAGGAALTNPDLLRPAGEPFAKMRITVARTGEKKDVTLDALGLLPSNFSLSAGVGDKVTFSITDGASNTDFSLSTGATLEVVGKKAHPNDIPDPRPTKDYIDSQGRITVGMEPFRGQMIVNGMNVEDVKQGYIGDCYLPAAIASALHYSPSVVQKMIKQNADGSYAVTFYEKNAAGKYVAHVETVDSDLYYDASKNPIFGKAEPSSVDNMELWWPLIEKAYASWNGSYEAIGNGGLSSDVFSAIYGKDAKTESVGTADAQWKKIKAQVDAKKPGALGTGAEGPRYNGTGVHGNHAYSILGYEVDKTTKQRYVVLRNPWGYSEPGEEDGGDGLFKLEIEKVSTLFDNYYSLK